MAKKYYAVKMGHKPGIYTTWEACKKQVHGFSGAVYKSFTEKEDAEKFMDGAGKAREIEKELLSNQDVVQQDPRIMVAYVDGSYLHTTKEFSYGAVCIHQGQEYTFAQKYSDGKLAAMRNVAGEIQGARKAMEFALEKCCIRVVIHYDYEGIAKWCLGEWNAGKEGTRAYKDYFDSIKDKIEVVFIKVKAHSGDKYNDMADMLAKSVLGLA